MNCNNTSTFFMNNHKFLCALAVSVMVGASSCVPTFAQQRMSLQSLFDLTDQQSQRIKVSEVALKAAEEGVASAKSALLPSVELSVQGSYTGNAFLMSRGFSTSGTTEYIVPGLGPQQVQNGKQPTPHWGNSFTAQVSQVIYAGGAIRSGIEMAKLEHQLAELDIEKNRQEVRFLVTGYYLDLYKLQNQSQVIAKNIELTEKVIEQMKARREQGTVLKNDITRYELQLQSLVLAKTQVDDAQKIIRHQIGTTIHLPEGEDFEIDAQSLEEEGMALKAITSEELWQQKATENNIDIRQASLATEMSEQKLRNTRAASLPSVAVIAENNLFGPYTSDLIPKNANVNVWFVGICVKYNLSSLWKNKHNIRKAKHESTQAHETVQLAREGVEDAVQANYTNLLTSSVEVSTQEKQVELADQNYAVVKNRYGNDLALLTDMLDASNMKLSADIALVNARINMLYNYFKLKYITNTL
ncbi:MAG: TolC family protein [Paludibacteraceae bacterium]|nr:TolC family protein [Paludibacteraceae bacterium]